MEGMHPLVGKALLNQKNKIVSADAALRNIRLIVLYFTGSWCTKHQEVTLILKEIHEEGIRREFGLEVVNVPCETNVKEMIEHFNLQGNWYSIVYGDIIAQELRWMFTINFIPSIIAISTSTGNIVSKNGLQEVLNEKLNVLVKWDIS